MLRCERREGRAEGPFIANGSAPSKRVRVGVGGGEGVREGGARRGGSIGSSRCGGAEGTGSGAARGEFVSGAVR